MNEALCWVAIAYALFSVCLGCAAYLISDPYDHEPWWHQLSQAVLMVLFWPLLVLWFGVCMVWFHFYPPGD